MDIQREHDIFRNVLKMQLKSKGIQVSNIRREMGNTARELNELDPSLNVTADELFLLIKTLVEELVAEAFKPRKFEVTNVATNQPEEHQ